MISWKTRGNPAQKKREKEKEKRRTEQEAFGIHSGFLCVDCIAKFQRAERKLRALRYLFFHRNIKFTAQQRGLDFALVQARHSSKVISYFATKRSLRLCFRSGLVWKSKVRKQESEKLAQPSTLTGTRICSSAIWLPWLIFKPNACKKGSKMAQLDV